MVYTGSWDNVKKRVHEVVEEILETPLMYELEMKITLDCENVPTMEYKIGRYIGISPVDKRG